MKIHKRLARSFTPFCVVRHGRQEHAQYVCMYVLITQCVNASMVPVYKIIIKAAFKSLLQATYHTHRNFIGYIWGSLYQNRAENKKIFVQNRNIQYIWSKSTRVRWKNIYLRMTPVCLPFLLPSILFTWSTVSLYFVLYYVDSVVFILYLHIPIWNFYKKRNKTRGTWQTSDTDENLMVHGLHVITQPYLICKIGQSHKKTMKGSQCTTLIKVSSLLLLWMKRKMSWGHEVVYSN